MTDGAAARSAWLVAPLAVVPLVILAMAGADMAWLFLGAATWVVALAVKIPVMGGLSLLDTPAWLGGLLAGIASAGVELGIAIVPLVRASHPPGILDLILFAAAAGSTEALAVLAWALLVRTPPDQVATWTDAASRSRVVRHSVVLERTVAWFGHLGSRSLIGLAVVYQAPWLGAVAATTFAATDGLAARHQASKVDWFAPGVLGRFLGFAFGLVVVELAVLVGYLTFGVPG